MPISILDISRKPEGTTETRAIHFDTLEDVDLAQPLEGEVTIMVVHPRLFSAHVLGKAYVHLDCDRCLKRYTYSLNIDFTAEYADDQEQDEWPVENNAIDLSEPIRQEVLLRLPFKSLCSPDCKGILNKTN